MSASFFQSEPSAPVTICAVFTEAQQAAMAQQPLSIRVREGLNGSVMRRLSRMEAVGAANRIFGLGGWDFVCEVVPVSSEITAKQVLDRGRHAYKEVEILRVMYRARARVTVRGAGGQAVIREASGVGMADCLRHEANPALAHEAAIQRAEGEALAAALESFGPAFGGKGAEPPVQARGKTESPAPGPTEAPEAEAPTNVVPLRAAPRADDAPLMTVSEFLAVHEHMIGATEPPPRTMFEPWATEEEATQWAKDLAEQVRLSPSREAVVAAIAAHEEDVALLERVHDRLAGLLIHRATERLAALAG